MLQTVPDFAGKKKKRKNRHKQAWKEVALHPLLSAGPADPGPAEAAQEEHLLIAASASGLLLDLHSFGFVCRHDDSLLPRRLWLAGRGVRGKRNPRCCVMHDCSNSCGPEEGTRLAVCFVRAIPNRYDSEK